MSEFSFDEECFRLAEYFLPSAASDRLKNELAQSIQTTIEDWFEMERERLIAELGPGALNG